MGTIGILYGVSSTILLSSFEAVERQKTEQDVERVMEAITTRQTTLQANAIDYAVWDATYDFVQGKKPDYPTTDIGIGTFNTARIDLIVIRDAQQQIVHSVNYDRPTGKHLPLPPELQADLSRSSYSSLLNQQQTGFLQFGHTLALVASHPILTSEGQGPSVGSLILAQYLTPAAVQQLGQVTQLTIGLYPLSGALPLDVQQASATLSDSASRVIQPLDRQTIAGYVLIPDIRNQPIAVLKISKPRTIYQQGLLSLRYLAMSLLIVGGFAGIVMWRLVQQAALLLAERNQIKQALRQETALRQADLKYRQKAQELEQTLRELQHTQARLVQSEKMSSLGRLVAGIAHEINNPVNFISGNVTYAADYVQVLLQLVNAYQQHYPIPPEVQAEFEDLDLDFLKEDLLKLLNSMAVGSERIQQIVLSLRSFSRLDETAIKTVDLHAGIESTLLLLQHRLQPDAIPSRLPCSPSIRVIRAYGDLPPVECYPSQLNQVFMNVLTNAIEALQRQPMDAAPPTIWIETELQGDHVIARFGNNGPSIPEAIQNQVFDPFFTTKPVGQGTGLGLAISYQIVVENHHGQIYCQNCNNRVEFVMHIPLRLRSAAPAVLQSA
ncbi:MAG: GHKL domain-containing protein [Synechococcales cyanobacterium M58_A2018_015]|nr:GHKL domain-containing protein [Synechococcales cyanobacterium M58_A2018_015]